MKPFPYSCINFEFECINSAFVHHEYKKNDVINITKPTKPMVWGFFDLQGNLSVLSINIQGYIGANVVPIAPYPITVVYLLR